jgi:hypothetical protein
VINVGWTLSERKMTRMLGGGRAFAARKSCIAVAACSIALLMTPSSVAAWGPYNNLDPAFCDSSTVRGNPEELRRLPPLHQAPSSEQLPFAPETTRFRQFDEFQIGEAEIGFALRQSNGHRTDPLGLTVIATFTRINRQGNLVESIGRIETQVSSIKGYETISFFRKVSRPGFYRVGIFFWDNRLLSLGKYGAYFRLLPLRIRPPRLALNARTFKPGDQVLARVENFSSESISYGVPYRIERLDGAAWMRAPESPGRFIKPLYRSGPGSTGPCLPFGIPPSMPSGTYRMVKPIRFESPLFARFEVLPTS